MLIDKNDAKTRVQWLLCTALLFVIFPAFVFFGISKLFVLQELTFINYKECLFASIVYIPLLYYFAFLKVGTKVLTLSLVVSSVHMIRNVIEMLKQYPNIDLVNLLILLIEVSIYFWWFMLSIRMLNINKKIRLKLESIE